MPNYRRWRPEGATYFFTLNLANRGGTLLTDRIDLLRQVWGATLIEAPVKVDAMVVLPGHCHAIWTLPPGDARYSERWRRMKARFSHAVGREHRAVRQSLTRRREAGVWQRRFWEHVIRDEEDFTRHLAYCWSDPVRHGLVEKAADWPHSSMQRDIRRGLVDREWRAPVIEGRFGE